MTVSLCFCDVGGDMQFPSHYVREEDSLQARLSLFTFNGTRTCFSSPLLNRFIPSWGGYHAPKHASEGVLVPEHLQSTAQVPLSNEPRRPMLTCGLAMVGAHPRGELPSPICVPSPVLGFPHLTCMKKL